MTSPTHGDPVASLTPMDAHNRRLLAQVHPHNWVNPPPRGRYHLVVIGAGTAGLVAAAGAAGLGARVALIERSLMGGDCLNVGCVPSKALIAAARVWATARSAAADFHGPAATGPGDFAAVMERMRRLRADLSPIDGAARFRDLGVDVFLGSGRFTGRDSIAVGESTLHFRRAVIATGARAAAPPIAGLDDVPYLTNESLFSLTTLPTRLLIIGGGPLGCEMAQCFARFGSEVTLVDRGAQVLPREDADASRIIHDALERDGVRILLDTEIRNVVRQGAEIVISLFTPLGEEDIIGDAVLVATGRAPNVEGLGLDVGGVAVTEAGISVDDRFRTTNRRVYAAGDVCSALQFTHAADFQARAVIQNALFFGRSKRTHLIVPWATYTSPEVAHVGHTEASAIDAGLKVQTIDIPLHDVDRARLDGQMDGFARVHVRAGHDTILGATIVAERAGDLIAEVTLAMTNGLGLAAIGRTMHPYPTQGDVLRKAADAWRRQKLTPFVRAAFRLWFTLFK